MAFGVVFGRPHINYRDVVLSRFEQVIQLDRAGGEGYFIFEISPGTRRVMNLCHCCLHHSSFRILDCFEGETPLGKSTVALLRPFLNLPDDKRIKSTRDGAPWLHSHSIVPGGLLVISKHTRLTPLTSLIMRFESVSRRSYGSFTQSAVMPSWESTARTAMVYS